MAAKLKKGDKVVVLTGKDKGKTGEILQILVEKNRALVGGINLVRRHTKQSASQEAGIISKEAPLHLSNLAFADPKDGKATRVGFEIKDGKKQRIAKRSGEVING
ncbi:LSU ribosomal protein L24p (L26e) [hydrothermal vent metagenome]|uniref:LSU ribosomal protein L24p (L26e) n=1 Tax=hydrothermal vent metagenome TaxID=652676 RepID=A0A3B0TWT2_9ZZZZ